MFSISFYGLEWFLHYLNLIADMKLDTAANGWHPSFNVAKTHQTYCWKLQLRKTDERTTPVEKYICGDAGIEEFREWPGWRLVLRFHSWEIQLRDTLEKYSWEFPLRNTVAGMPGWKNSARGQKNIAEKFSLEIQLRGCRDGRIQRVGLVLGLLRWKIHFGNTVRKYNFKIRLIKGMVICTDIFVSVQLSVSS